MDTHTKVNGCKQPTGLTLQRKLKIWFWKIVLLVKIRKSSPFESAGNKALGWPYFHSP